MKWYRIVAGLSHFSFYCLEKVYVILRKTVSFAQAVQTGFWLGVMGEKSLDYSDEMIYNVTKKYRNDKYNLSGLFDWEKAMIGKHFAGAKSIIVIAAGGGREIAVLSRMGYEVEGFECNPVLAEYGDDLLKREGIRGSIKYLPRNTVPETIKQYDGIIVGWGAYSLIDGSAKRMKFLNDLYPFMHKDSSMMLSVIYQKQKNKSDRIVKKVSDFFRLFSGREKTELGDMLFPDYMHYFTEEELRKELTGSNYKVKDFVVAGNGCIVAGI